MVKSVSVSAVDPKRAGDPTATHRIARVRPADLIEDAGCPPSEIESSRRHPSREAVPLCDLDEVDQ